MPFAPHAVQEVDGGAQAKAERHHQRDNARELKTFTDNLQQHPCRQYREDARQKARRRHRDGAEGKSYEPGNEDEFEGESSVQCVDHARTVARGDDREARHFDSETGMGGAHRIEPAVQFLYDRQ